MIDGRVQYMKLKGGTIWQDGDTRGIEPRDTVIFKKSPSAFFGTTLSTELQLMIVNTLVLCGVSTSGCVRATTLDAMCYGFRPMVRYRDAKFQRNTGCTIGMWRSFSHNTKRNVVRLALEVRGCGDRRRSCREDESGMGLSTDGKRLRHQYGSKI
jgi:hypothetical protein